MTTDTFFSGFATLTAGDGVTAERKRRNAGGRPAVGRALRCAGRCCRHLRSGFRAARCCWTRPPTIPPIHPSATPQIVSEVQKNDPKAKLGAREHPRILATYGGEYHDEKIDKLVARIVGSLTAVSENPNQTYRITILNSPSVNAFALPGGYIYVTRGLLALADDASEVAAVIAHEMGM